MMRENAELAVDAWVRLSLFYVQLDRGADDGGDVRFRAEVLYGEGELLSVLGSRSIRAENLGGGIHLLRVENTLEEVTRQLLGESFDLRLGSGRGVVSFTFGWIRRPPIVGIVGGAGTIESPISESMRLHQFVRVDKRALLGRIARAGRGAEQGPEAVTNFLNVLKRVAGVDLRREHIQWLGDVVVAERRIRVAWWNRVNSADGRSCRAITVSVGAEARALHVQVRVAGVDGMCICDRMLFWSADNEKQRTLEFQEEVREVFLRAWVDGELAMEERAAVLRGFNMRIGLGGEPRHLQDRLTQKLEMVVRGGAANQRAREVLASVQRLGTRGFISAAQSSMRSEPWDGLDQTASAVLDFVAPPTDGYAYFPSGAEGRAQAILHFVQLFSRAEKAFLVDPFFDASGAAALLPRLHNDAPLTVITNLPIDHRQQTSALSEFMKEVGAVTGLPDALRVVCASRRDSVGQAFHDRWLLILRDGHWRGFVLTNSFSGMAVRYPLYVVEAPHATTARMLAETEELIDSPRLVYNQLWPTKSLDASRKRETAGAFPYQWALIAGLSPSSGSPARRLLSAEAASLIRIADTEVRWQRTSTARQRVLDWMLSGPERTRSIARRRGRRERVKRARPFGVGQAVIVLGNLAAWGLDVRADEVARRLTPRESKLVERALDETFLDGPDPTVARAGTPLSRLRMRQSLRREVTRIDAAKHGLGLWNAAFWDVGRSDWGRQFAYSVLMIVAPERAVTLCEKLLDVDFLMTLVHALRHKPWPWSSGLSHAMLACSSPVLQALGAQQLVQGAYSGPQSMETTRPSNVAAALHILRARQVSEDQLAYYLAVWGVGGDQGDTVGGVALADELVRALDGVEPVVRSEVIALLFDHGLRGQAFLAHFVAAAAVSSGTAAMGLLEGVVQYFAKRFRSGERGDTTFSRSVDIQTTEVVATAASAIAKRSGARAADELRCLIGLDEMRSEFEKLTPFRRRCGASGTDVALGWGILLLLLVARQDSTRPRKDEAAVALARAYLAEPVIGASEDVRMCVREQLADLDCLATFREGPVD